MPGLPAYYVCKQPTKPFTMVCRSEFFLLVFIAAVFLLYLLTSNQYETHYHSNKPLKYEPNILEDSEEFINLNFSLATIQDVLRITETNIKRSLSDYRWPPNTDLHNFTLATGGRPLRSVIITTWRSGSTFLGDVMNAVPGNFYHYEPLLDYGIIQIRGPPHAESALRNLRNLLNCDYSNLQNYLEYGQLHTYLFTHNTRLWNLCKSFPQFCWEPGFLSSVCRLFPFQSLKTVRLRLRLAEELLEDQKLNVKVLLLIRDPRGTLQSRKHRLWCPGEPDCDEPKLLCADMVSDYSAAFRLKKMYPHRFRAMRYEDLSLDPYAHVEDLFKFFGLRYDSSISEFLDTHTKMNFGGVSSTFRDSKSAPFHWRMDLNFSEVQYIEENCEVAMKLWGYVKAKDELHLREFNPVTNYTVS